MSDNQSNSTSSGKPNRGKPRSYEKKYSKLMLRFSDSLDRAEQLHSINVLGRKLFNRILREKNQITELLLTLNESEKFPEKYKIKRIEDIQNEKLTEDKEKEKLTRDELFYINLIDKAMEFTNEEEVLRDEPNPMVLSEWLHRHKPKFTGMKEENINNGSESRKRKQMSEEDEDEHKSKKPFVGGE